MRLHLSAFFVFLLGISLLFAGGISFTVYGSVFLLLGGSLACFWGGLQCRQAGGEKGVLGLALPLAWQDFGLTAESLGLGSFLFLYNQGVLPLIGFSAAFLFLLNALLTQLALLSIRSVAGRKLAFAAASGMPLTLGAAAAWQLLQGWLTLPEVEPAGWVKLLLAVGIGTFAFGWSRRFSAFCRLTGLSLNGELSVPGVSECKKTGTAKNKQEQPATGRSAFGSGRFPVREAIFPALLLAGGLYPAPLVTLVQQLVLQGEVSVHLADYLGMIWGGSGHYALYSPLLLAGWGMFLCLVLYLVDRLRGKGGAL